ncbi:hypothetical protein GWN42_00535, partial [candidate division KSB1 bacterium]|nr:hypothetical protein [candidate division KSB1 bacterium]
MMDLTGNTRQMQSRFLNFFIILLTLSSLSLIGCQKKEEAEQTEVSDQSASVPDTVEVELTEYEIDMPVTMTAGPKVFKIKNTGQADHNIAIEGQEINQALEQDLKSGESGTMQIQLQPGDYDVYCPV